VSATTTRSTTPARAAEQYQRMVRRKRLLLAGLVVLTLAVLLCNVAVGGGSLPLGDLLHACFAPWTAAPATTQIVWNIRMPIALTAVLVGGALAVAGAEMQTILNNPLAEPYTLGISAAAGFGAALSVVTGLSALPLGAVLGTAGSAWVFAMLACGLIVTVSLLRGASTETMILLGIALVFLFTALLSLMQYVASDAQLQQVLFWTLGSLSRATWPQVGTIAVVLAVLTPVFHRASWTLTAFRLGDDRAQALGIAVQRTRILALVGVSLLAATAVAFAGTIGFIGLVGPHIARILIGEDQRYFLPASLLCGSTLLCGAALAAQLIVPGVVIPVGIITSLVGVPVFLVIVLSQRRNLWS
jgi:iron complex transport system permease protein